MSREAHVRVCEGLGVKVPRATRLCSFVNSNFLMFGICQFFIFFLAVSLPVDLVFNFTNDKRTHEALGDFRRAGLFSSGIFHKAPDRSDGVVHVFVKKADSDQTVFGRPRHQVYCPKRVP